MTGLRSQGAAHAYSLEVEWGSSRLQCWEPKALEACWSVGIAEGSWDEIWKAPSSKGRAAGSHRRGPMTNPNVIVREHALRDLLRLARELALQLDGDLGEDSEFVEVQLLRAVEAVESELDEDNRPNW